MGGDRVKVQNLEVLKVYAEQNLIVVNGSIPEQGFIRNRG